jgi:alpha-aminoadipic semialdehyde synthase
MVDYLHRDQNLHIIIGSQFKDEADALASKYSDVEPLYLNVLEHPDSLKEAMERAEVVVSLLPYSLHHVVAKSCIQMKKHLVTASYLNDEVKSLHEE